MFLFLFSVSFSYPPDNPTFIAFHPTPRSQHGWIRGVLLYIKRLEWCTLWSMLKFQKFFTPHPGNDISRETNRITNATMVSSVTVAM
jgi:hypothetical protein